jgi:hypothetical protein
VLVFSFLEWTLKDLKHPVKAVDLEEDRCNVLTERFELGVIDGQSLNNLEAEGYDFDSAAGH